MNLRRSGLVLPLPSQHDVRNRLLRGLPAEAFAVLQPSLVHMDLPKGELISEVGTEAPWAVFPENGLASVVNRSFNGRQLEVGVFGRDGVGGMGLLLKTGQTPYATFMQVAGDGWRVEADVFRTALDGIAGMHEYLLRYMQAFVVQIAQTALANSACTIEQRLARWLLMVHDRVDGDELRLTHEFLSVMLGVRRTGVTLAVHMLEGGHMIQARRGVVLITDRDKLQKTAGDGYGTAEAEYERLLGPMR